MSCTYMTKTIKTSYGEIKLSIWDTVGLEQYRSLTRIFCKDSDCVVFGYSVDNKSTFNEIKYYYQLYLKN